MKNKVQENIQLINNLIDNYMNLQIIKHSDDIQQELEYQLKIIRFKLKLFGINTSDFEYDAD